MRRGAHVGIRKSDSVSRYEKKTEQDKKWEKKEKKKKEKK